MRITFRDRGVKEYWNARWANIPANTPMENMEVYPLKYAEMIIGYNQVKILEAGCGAVENMPFSNLPGTRSLMKTKREQKDTAYHGLANACKIF